MTKQMIDKVFFFMGAIFTFYGFIGMASACVDGQGSFLISAVVFAIGVGFSLLEFVKGSEWEDR